MDPPRPPLNTFVLRLWSSTAEGIPVWRGCVRHIQTGEHLAFTDEETLLGFLRRWVVLPTGPLAVAREEAGEGHKMPDVT